MYRRLAKSLSVRTVTFAEYLAGNPARMIDAHPPQEEVHQLFAASWIDETRSAPGVDLGTWIGEPSENYAWELLGEARSVVDGAPSEVRSRALTSIFAAEGSDWFWWLGDDQDSARDEVFDEIFRAHLRSAYTAVGLAAPERLAAPLSPRRVIWSVTQPAQFVMPGDELVVRTNCPGSAIWREDEGPEKCANLHPFGGVLAGNRRFQARLGRVSSAANCIDFRLECSEPSCSERDRCCSRAKGHLPVRARLT